MLAQSLSNHLKFQTKDRTQSSTNNRPRSNHRLTHLPEDKRKSSSDNYQVIFKQLFRKHHSQLKQNKIVKSYIPKNNLNSNLNMIIPSFITYESSHKQKFDCDHLIKNICQDQRSSISNRLFDRTQSFHQQISERKVIGKTQIMANKNNRIMARKKYSFFSTNTDKKIVEKQEIDSQLPDLVAFNSEILPITTQRNTKKQKTPRQIRNKNLYNIDNKIKSIKINDNQLFTSPSKYSQKKIMTNLNKSELVLYKKYMNNFQKFIQEFSRRSQIPENTKIFIFQSSDVWIKEALLSRGWIQNEDSGSRAFHLKWSTKIDKQYKRYPQQILNHFYRSDLITSKGQFAKYTRGSLSLRKSIPRSFDLGSQLEQFNRNFDQTTILCTLKKIISTISPSQQSKQLLPQQIIDQFAEMHEKQEYLEKVPQYLNQQKILHLPYTVQILAFAIKIMCQLQNIIFSQEYQLNEKSMKNLLNFSELDPPYHRYKPHRSETHENQIKFSSGNINFYSTQYSFNYPSKILQNLIKSVHGYLCQNLNTYEVQGIKNIWIVKARNSSKGIGISLSNQHYQICSKTENRLVQKYIENCLLYPFDESYFKFDTRIWVLVTNYNPLICYYYSNFYGRICSSSYNLNQLSLLTSHLTNYHINRKNYIQTSTSQPLVSQNQSIISSEQFFNFVFRKNNNLQDNPNNDQNSQKYNKQISSIKRNFYKQLETILLSTLKQYTNIMQTNKFQQNNFELFGFDVLVSQILTLHLLQVNLSPACDAKRSQYLHNNVNSMAQGLLDIILNQKDNQSKMKRQDSNFEQNQRQVQKQKIKSMWKMIKEV